MNKKFFLIISLTAASIFFLPFRSQAQETSTTSPTPTVDPKTKGVRDAVKDKIEEKIGEILNKEEKRGWIGTITETSATGFKINVNEDIRTTVLNDEAVIINQNRQKIDFQDLETNQRAIVMGYVQVDGSLDARRIVLVGEKEPRERQSFFGTITEKAAQDEIILIKNGEESYELIFDQNSTMKKRQDSETGEIEYQDLATNQKIVVITSPTNGNTATYKVEELLVISSPEAAEEESESESESEAATESGQTAPESTDASPTLTSEE